MNNVYRNQTVSAPLRVAIIGLGGFAGRHHAALHDLEKDGLCRVVATCDPFPEKFEALFNECDFQGRGIRVHTDYFEMLDAHRDEIDFVTVPTPIPLHGAMHRACVERGLACYVEKPPSLLWEEMDEMLLVEQGADKQTAAGFAHIVEAPRQELKRRLVRGDFGQVRRVGFTGHWPRDTAYFQRAPWAGRLQLNGRLVLDSCIGNAMSHYIHNLLFWCGQGEVLSWGEVQEVEAQLYRAHAIENFDTCFARAKCTNGIEIGVAATHTGEADFYHLEWIECDQATIAYTTGATIHHSILWHDGHEESGYTQQGDPLRANVIAYMSYLRGETDRPATRLIDSRPFVHFNNLLYVAAGTIQTIPESFVQRNSDAETLSTWISVEGMHSAIEALRVHGSMPNESGVPWAYAGGQTSSSRMRELADIIRLIGCVPV